MGYGSCEQSLTGTRWSIEQDTLWLGDAERLENLRMLDRKLNDFFHFLDLLFETTDLVVSRVWNLLDLHEADKWVFLIGHDHVQAHSFVVFEGHASVGN